VSGTVDGLKLDRGELAEGAVSPSAGVRPLNPGHDRKPELVAVSLANQPEFPALWGSHEH
jgi:hypothetical protein